MYEGSLFHWRNARPAFMSSISLLTDLTGARDRPFGATKSASSSDPEGFFHGFFMVFHGFSRFFHPFLGLREAREARRARVRAWRQGSLCSRKLARRPTWSLVGPRVGGPRSGSTQWCLI